METRSLLTSTDLALDDIVRRVHALGGLTILPHIDCLFFNVLANLGLVPPAWLSRRWKSSD